VKEVPKIMLSIPKAIYEWLEEERKKRGLDTIQQVIRIILSENYKKWKESREKAYEQ